MQTALTRKNFSQKFSSPCDPSGRMDQVGGTLNIVSTTRPILSWPNSVAGLTAQPQANTGAV